MADTYTTVHGITKPDLTEATNGTKLNANFDTIDAALNFASLRRKNAVLNGGFQIDQAAGSYANLTGVAAIHTLDQWLAVPSTTGDVTITQQAFTLGQTDVPGNPAYFLRFVWNTGATAGTPQLVTDIEGVAQFSGEEVTLSFWARVASGTASLDTALRQYFGSGGSPSTAVSTASETHSITTTWTRFSQTVTLASVSGKTLGSNGDDALRAQFLFDLSETATFDFADVQLELGPVATRYDRRTYAQELHDCQRFFVRLDHSGSRDRVLGTGYCASSTEAIVAIPIPVPMRALPSITATLAATYVSSEGATYTPSASAVDALDATALLNVALTISGATANDEAAWRLRTTDTAGVLISARLR